MTTDRIPAKTTVLALLMAALVAFSATAGVTSAAATTDLTVSITDQDNTVAPGETTTVAVAVANADGGVGASELGITSSDPGVAAITDVSVLHDAGSTDNTVSGGGQSADVKYAFADSPETGSVTIVEVTLQAASEGETTINVVENSQTGNLVVFDEDGAGYTLAAVGSATLTVEDVNQEPTAAAGDDQTVGAGDTVTLDGSASSDPDGSIASYEWSETTSSGVSLSDASAQQPTFSAPDVDSATTLEFQLEVTDDDGATDTDAVSVTVQPPEAANFQVSNLQAPGSTTQGDDIDVAADVENTGGQTATKAVEFRVDTDGDGSIDDESAVASQDVELDPGESTTVTFEDVDTSGLSVGTLTHGVATADDSETAGITINEPAQQPDTQTALSLEPTDGTTAVGTPTTFDVVVENAQGGVGAGEIAVSVDDTSIATITDVDVLHGANVDVLVTDSAARFDYFGADTADSGQVAIATVTVEGAGEGTADLSIEPTDENSEVLLFDEVGTGYDVSDTTGASVEVLPVQFLVEDESFSDEPAKTAVGSSVTITAEISSDGAVQSEQPVELLFDVDGDGEMESVETQQMTVGAGATETVSFTVDVPEDAAYGERDYEVVTLADSQSGVIEVTPPAVNEDQNLPGDLDDDGLYEDVNGDGSADSGDAQSLFSNRDGDTVQNNAAAFDFNGDGTVNVGDAQALFGFLAA